LKKLILLFFSLTFAFSLWAEYQIPRHGLTAHLGGVASLYEIEYNYRFLVKEKHAFSLSIAINSAAINVGFPLGINYTYGQKNQFFASIRFVLDVLLISFDEEVIVPSWAYFANLRVGYGREIVLFKQKCTLYAYVSPAINLISGKTLPWAGIGLTQYF